MAYRPLKLCWPPWLSLAVPSHWFKWELPGGLRDSGFSSFGRALLPWWGVTVDEAAIRSLSFTLESIVESAVKAIADCQAKVVLDRIDLWSSFGWARTCLWDGLRYNPAPGLTLLGKLSSGTFGLDRWLLPQRLSLIYLILIGLGLGDHGSKVHFKH